MRTPRQISDTMSSLLRRLDEEFGAYLDPDLVASMVAGSIAQKASEQIEAIIGTFSADELILASTALAEISVDEARASVIREKQ